MRKDSQHQGEEVQNWSAYLEHAQSILIEFYADYAPGKSQLGHTFYDGLRPLIRVWVEEIYKQQMSWDDIVSAANRTEVKARIHSNHYLNQQCPRRKRPMKMNINFNQDNQPEIAEPKATALQAKANPHSN